MSYWAMISLGMSLATKVMVVANIYKHLPKKVAIAKITAKLNETLDEMVLE